MSFQRNFTFSLIISESEHSVETSGKGLDVTRVKKLHNYEFRVQLLCSVVNNFS